MRTSSGQLKRSAYALACALGLAGAVLGPGPVEAADAAASPASSPRLEIVDNVIRLPPIRLEDLAERSVESLGASTRTLYRRGNALVSSGDLVVPPVRLTVTRELRSVWRMRLPATQDAFSSNVRVSVESNTGSDQLTKSDDPNSTLSVRAIARPATTVAADARSRTIEGDISLEIDLRHIESAGRYTGRLVVSYEGT